MGLAGGGGAAVRSVDMIQTAETAAGGAVGGGRGTPTADGDDNPTTIFPVTCSTYAVAAKRGVQGVHLHTLEI